MDPYRLERFVKAQEGVHAPGAERVACWPPLFQQVLDTFFAGERDPRTVDLAHA